MFVFAFHYLLYLPSKESLKRRALSDEGTKRKKEYNNDTKKDRQKPRNAVVWRLGGSGMGSQLVSMLGVQLYLDQIDHRDIIIDESCYNSYRSNDQTTGLLSTYFTPTMKVIENSEDQAKVLEEYGVGKYSIQDCKVNETSPNSMVDIFLRGSAVSKPLLFADVWSHDSFFVKGFNYVYQNRFPNRDYVYRTLSSYGCPSLQFNSETKAAIKLIKEKAGLSERFIIENDDPSDSLSVTFHIRRGDKAIEVEPVNAEKYVLKLLDVADSDISKITHCFVATDDHTAVEELLFSLQQHQIPCHLETLAPDDRKGTSFVQQHYQTLEFMAELSIAIESTYFIGTFSSNIGKLVAILRSCKSSSNLESGDDNYFRSYSVDKDWSIL